MSLHCFKNTLSILLLGVACVAVPATLGAEGPEATKPDVSASTAQGAEKPKADQAAFVEDLAAYVSGVAPPSAQADARTQPSAIAALPGPGHNAFMMLCTALVLFMTLPGLALFYGGLVRKKNVLSVLAQCMGIAGLATILWWAVGFSLSFGTGNAFIGNFDFVFLKSIGGAPSTLPWVSETVWAMFQLTFAIITPALIVGAIAERMKFTTLIAFVALWSFFVYYPLAHMVWGGGLMSGAKGVIKAIDFAGGAVVHMSSGYSALVLCLILGPRLGLGRVKMAPHSMVLCMIGTAILWIGWYGFNAGSAGGATDIAANAFMTTTLAAAIGGFTWATLEFAIKKHASVLGFCSGIVGGLVVITPAAGFVNATGGVICGLLAGSIPFFACVKLKAWLGYDDALDTFGVHAVGGTVGTLVTGILATADVNPMVADVLAASASSNLLWEQTKAAFVTVGWSVVATVIIAFALKYTMGLRPSSEAETQGLDINDHGEEGYTD
ncbi:MAG: ammonium transporter [Puniceicoccales bacterium]|jgi:Amt family ammonium transporter|nr:ammonium transporter [Puniceicoccales bacterium]